MRPRVTVEIYPAEIDYKPVSVGDTRRIHIESNWSRSNLVQVTIEGKTYLVLGEDLKRAVDCAMNVRRA